MPGLFFGLPNLNVGDELFVDGMDRASGAAVTHRRFVVSGLYLADIDSGQALVEQAAAPSVILQTSVREEGANRPWLLNQQTILAKARSVVQGDLGDPCKYLLLFVIARPS